MQVSGSNGDLSDLHEIASIRSNIRFSDDICRGQYHARILKYRGDNVNSVRMFGCKLSKDLLGLTEYHSCILSDTELYKKESEFRSKKLGLILDFIRAIGIPENLERELTTSIIDSWRLKIPDTTLKQREIEQKKLVRSLNRIRTVINWMEKCEATINSSQIHFRVLSNLPIDLTDLQPEDAPRIQGLINRVMDCCTTLMGEGLSHKPDACSH